MPYAPQSLGSVRYFHLDFSSNFHPTHNRHPADDTKGACSHKPLNPAWLSTPTVPVRHRSSSTGSLPPGHAHEGGGAPELLMQPLLCGPRFPAAAYMLLGTSVPTTPTGAAQPATS